MKTLVWLFFTVIQVTASLHLNQHKHISACKVVHKNANCSGLNLISIPAQLHHGIHVLDLSCNFLQNLTEDLSSYHTLNQLNLHSNRIKFIQPGLFQNKTHLHFLDLSRNHLDLYAALKTNVGPLTSVKELDLSRNGLYTDMSDYFLRDAPALTNLSLHGNSITKVGKNTFSGSPALRKIDLHNNVIMEIEEGTFDSLHNLTELDLSMNSISCIINFNLFQLELLNLSKNSMISFHSTEPTQEFKLLYLDLRENKIRNFPVLPNKNKIIHLDLSRNQLTSVNFTAEGVMLPELRYLDLSYNLLKFVPPNFFSSMTSLETLNLSNNCLDSFEVDTGSPLNALKTLDLSFTNLQNLTFGNNTLKLLETLYLHGNSLTMLDSGIFSSLPSIMNLHLQLNELRVCGPHENQTNNCVSFSSLPRLQYLYLSENNLPSLPAHAFRGSPLLILDLSFNPDIQIREQAFAGLETSLTYLSLRGNKLKDLNMDLSHLRRLKGLDLSSNQLTRLSLGSREFTIENLNLQDNSVETLDDHTVMALKGMLKTLYIASNPLSCCKNRHLINLVQQNSVKIPDIATVTCQFRKDDDYMMINLMDVTAEHCESLRNNTLLIWIIAGLVVGLMVVLLVVIKLCHSRSHRFNHSYKA